METIQTIMTRRSIRAFEDKPVAEDQIKIMLEAAMNAPSAGDGRPWQFAVTTDKAKLNALADQVDEGNPLIRQAGAAILICFDPAREGFKGFGEQDCACAAQNLQLAVHALGLGTVWLAVIHIPPRMTGCRNVFGVPENLVPFALFPVGVPAEQLPPEYRFDAKLIHREVW